MTYWTVFNTSQTPGEFYVGIVREGSDVDKDRARKERGLIFETKADAEKWIKATVKALYMMKK